MRLRLSRREAIELKNHKEKMGKKKMKRTGMYGLGDEEKDAGRKDAATSGCDFVEIGVLEETR